MSAASMSGKCAIREVSSATVPPDPGRWLSLDPSGSQGRLDIFMVSPYEDGVSSAI